MASAIEWTDETWNPVVGCSKVSPGCANCYAEAVHKARLSGKHGYPTFRPWTPENAEHNVTLMPHKLDQPLRWRRPRMIFVNSMSDLFHELVPDDFIWSVFGIMRNAPQHTFQVLTKRPERMRDLLAEWTPAPNVWLGTSIENRHWVGRADALRETPAAVRFISAEPLLGPLVFRIGRIGYPGEPEPRIANPGRRMWPDGHSGPQLNLDGIDWLIVGGESGGPKHRALTPLKAEWVRDLRDAARNTQWIVKRTSVGLSTQPPELGRTAFFFKQWGGRTAKAGGRELDGRTWDEYPVRAER